MSLRLRLTCFISGILLLACIITTSISYIELSHSLRQVLDSQQLLFANRLAAFNSHSNFMPGMRNLMLVDKPLEPHALDDLEYEDDAIAFAIFNRKGEMMINDGQEGKKFEFSGGFFSQDNQRATVNQQGKWRILWVLSNDGRSVIAVGQKMDYQQSILTQLVYKQLIPWLITFIVVLFFVVFFINRSFAPIKQLARKITQRKPDEDSPIELDGIPKEITPFVKSLNRLFSRIGSMISRERQFISDAAHELRTPLAALKVQTEVAQLSDDDPIARQKALHNLVTGIDRTTHLVDQLLTLSRLDSLELKSSWQTVLWKDVVKYVIEDLQLLADQKQIHINLEIINPAAKLEANLSLLMILIRNIINNAICYIPKNSTITIEIDKNHITFKDNGPGVTDEVLTRLGERFYRPAGQKENGSGLGLSIVKKIADLHQIQVKLSNEQPHGFCVELNYNEIQA